MMETPGPTSLEAYQLVHGDKEDTTSKEARLDKLYQDFRARMDKLLTEPAIDQSTKDSESVIWTYNQISGQLNILNRVSD